MSDAPLKVVDGLALPSKVRALLKPGEAMSDASGREHRLPRFFYEIGSWEAAKATLLAPHFTLAELMTVDSREADVLLREWPHYVPCAVSILARYLETFREKAGGPVFISANGGYRSPSHACSAEANPHLWGAGADIFRIGDQWLDDREKLEKFAQIAAAVAPEIGVEAPGETNDHLHLDIGYVTLVPRDVNEAEP